MAQRRKPTKENKPSVRLEKTIEGVLQGKSKRRAALDAGYAKSTASVDIYRLLEKPSVQARIRARIRDAELNTNEIIGTLVSHMRADLADICPDDPTLQAAKEAGVSHLIKKIRRKERFIPREGQEPEREVITEIEVHDSQSAAKHLIGVFGLEKRPETHPNDVARDERAKVEQFMNYMLRACPKCSGKDETCLDAHHMTFENAQSEIERGLASDSVH